MHFTDYTPINVTVNIQFIRVTLSTPLQFKQVLPPLDSHHTGRGGVAPRADFVHLRHLLHPHSFPQTGPTVEQNSRIGFPQLLEEGRLGPGREATRMPERYAKRRENGAGNPSWVEPTTVSTMQRRWGWWGLEQVAVAVADVAAVDDHQDMVVAVAAERRARAIQRILVARLVFAVMVAEMFGTFRDREDCPWNQHVRLR